MQRAESEDVVRLDGERCAVEIRRLRPGALLVVVTGDDAGELGPAPHDEITREIDRYGPVDLLVDARASTGVAAAVAREWLAFLDRLGDRVRRVRMVATSPHIALAAESAAASSRAGRRLSVTSDAEAFESEVRALGGPIRNTGWTGPVQRRRVEGGALELAAPGLRATVRALRHGAAEVVLAGFDGGRLCAPLFDELAAALADAPRWVLLLDARECTGVAGRSADAWAAWLRARGERVAALHVLAITTAVRLSLGIEGELAGLRRVLRVHTDLEPYFRARDDAPR